MSAQFLLSHRHEPGTCGVAYAAWKGFDSPLRHAPTLASCPSEPFTDGPEHVLVWTVDASTADAALALLPPWVAVRTVARQVAEVEIP
jgi:hypothetical protein